MSQSATKWAELCFRGLLRFSGCRSIRHGIDSRIPQTTSRRHQRCSAREAGLSAPRRGASILSSRAPANRKPATAALRARKSLPQVVDDLRALLEERELEPDLEEEDEINDEDFDFREDVKKPRKAGFEGRDIEDQSNEKVETKTDTKAFADKLAKDSEFLQTVSKFFGFNSETEKKDDK